MIKFRNKIIFFVAIYLGLFFIPGFLSAQTEFTRKFGNVNQSCGGYFLMPSNLTILRSKNDSLFISGIDNVSQHPGQPSLTLNVSPGGRLLNASIGQYTIMTGLTPKVDVSCPLFHTCIGYHDWLYFAGQRESDSISASHFKTFNTYFTKAMPIGSGNSTPNVFRHLTQFITKDSTSTKKGSRGIRIIPKGQNSVLLGNISADSRFMGMNYGYSNPRNTDSDSGFYVMEIDTYGAIYNYGCYSGATSGSLGRASSVSDFLLDKNQHYVITGFLKTTYNTQKKLHFVKLRTNGIVDKSVYTSASTLSGGFPNVYGTRIIQASNGHYIATGCFTDSVSKHHFGIFVSSLDSGSFSPTATNCWSYRYYFNSSDSDVTVVNDIKETNDGGFIITGSINLSSFYLLRLNKNGSVRWVKNYGRNYGWSVIQTSDLGFAATGVQFPYCHSYGTDICVVRTDSAGNSECAPITMSVTKNSLTWASTTNYNLRRQGTIVKDSLTDGAITPFVPYINEKDVCLNCCIDTDAFNTNSVHCVGDTLKMHGTLTGAKYEWYSDDGALLSNNSNANYVMGTEGSYDFHVKVIQSATCYENFCFRKKILPANKGFSHAVTGMNVQFTYNDTAYTNEYQWDWNFGDGSTHAIGSHPTNLNKMPTHTYAHAGMYHVCLTVRTGSPADFCETTICRSVCVQDANFDCCNCK
jgi:hypothetical protein